jgi:hypothetical protein
MIFIFGLTSQPPLWYKPVPKPVAYAEVYVMGLDGSD